MEAREAKGYPFTIGSGAVMPEIDEASIGLAAGGTRTVRVRFPDEHRNETLRGKSGEAVVKVTEVKEKVLPTLDDEFAKTVGEFETLDALRAEIEKGLMQRREQENRRELENAVMDAALAEHPFEVPESMALRQVGYQIEHMREHMRRQGIDPDRVPWNYEKMLEELRPGAEKSVRRALLIEAIAAARGADGQRRRHRRRGRAARRVGAAAGAGDALDAGEGRGSGAAAPLAHRQADARLPNRAGGDHALRYTSAVSRSALAT